MKFKEGDCVKIKGDLFKDILEDYEDECEETFGKEGVNTHMLKWKGKVVRICEVGINIPYPIYRIKDDNGEWFWNDLMIEREATKEEIELYEQKEIEEEI